MFIDFNRKMARSLMFNVCHSSNIDFGLIDKHDNNHSWVYDKLAPVHVHTNISDINVEARNAHGRTTQTNTNPDPCYTKSFALMCIDIDKCKFRTDPILYSSYGT